MKNSKPEISVIIPLFNREVLIKETIESLLAQTFRNWECIIVDDHSQDEGVSVVKGYFGMDSRIRCYLRPEKLKKGANSCRNYGLKKSQGEFIYWLDSDDIMHPHLLEFSQRFLIDSNLDYIRFKRKLFFGTFEKDLIRYEDVRPGKKLISSPELIETMLLNEIEFNTCNIVWRKASLKEEKFCEEIVYADEWEYYSRLLALGLKGRNLDNVLIFGRKHPESTTAEFKLENPARIDSKIKAIKLVLDTLNRNDLHTPKLKRYFLQMGFRLNSFEIIKKSLEVFRASRFEKWKFRMTYKFYPLLRPIFIFKSKISIL